MSHAVSEVSRMFSGLMSRWMSPRCDGDGGGGALSRPRGDRATGLGGGRNGACGPGRAVDERGDVEGGRGDGEGPATCGVPGSAAPSPGA
eukprot:3921866-Prymnesium_polylepis.2